MMSHRSLFSPATRQCLSSCVLSTPPLTSSYCFPFSRTQKRLLSQSTTYPFCLTSCMASLTSCFRATGSWHHHPTCCPLIKFNKHLSDFSLLQFSVPGKTPWKTCLSTSKTVFAHCSEYWNTRSFWCIKTTACHTNTTTVLMLCAPAPVVPHI